MNSIKIYRFIATLLVSSLIAVTFGISNLYAASPGTGAHVTPEQMASSRAPVRVAPARVAPARVAPARVAPTRVAPTRAAPARVRVR